jgi:hypothetical protein
MLQISIGKHLNVITHAKLGSLDVFAIPQVRYGRKHLLDNGIKVLVAPQLPLVTARRPARGALLLAEAKALVDAVGTEPGLGFRF